MVMKKCVFFIRKIRRDNIFVIIFLKDMLLICHGEFDFVKKKCLYIYVLKKVSVRYNGKN